jgi:hypothetical protein
MFQWFYWHSLLPGHPIPGIPSEMPRAGKHDPAVPDHAPASTEGGTDYAYQPARRCRGLWPIPSAGLTVVRKG